MVGGERGHISYDDLANMTDTGNVFKEVERLHPSVPGFMRRTVAETEVGGYTIPAHTAIHVSPLYTHRMEEWWNMPHSFDPELFFFQQLQSLYQYYFRILYILLPMPLHQKSSSS